MIERIKSAANVILGVLVLIVSALLFRKSRQLETSQSDLAHEQNTTEIKLNDQARENAKQYADSLVSEYERLRRDRDSN